MRSSYAEAGAEERYLVAEHAFALRGVERVSSGVNDSPRYRRSASARVRGVVGLALADVRGDVPAADEVLELPQRLRGDDAPRVRRVDAELRNVRENALAHVVLLVELLESASVAPSRSIATSTSSCDSASQISWKSPLAAIHQHQIDAAGLLAVERESPRRTHLAAMPLVRVVLPVPLPVHPVSFALLSCRDALVDEATRICGAAAIVWLAAVSWAADRSWAAVLILILETPPRAGEDRSPHEISRRTTRAYLSGLS